MTVNRTRQFYLVGVTPPATREVDVDSILDLKTPKTNLGLAFHIIEPAGKISSSQFPVAQNLC